jgi:hypothetical protein
MKNKLVNLNDILFAELERLSDEETKGEKLHEEIGRARAIEGTAKNVIENARLCLDVARVIDNGMNANLARTLPKMLTVSEPDSETEPDKPGKK